MAYHIPDKVYEEICRLAEVYGIRKIILFGSRARGTHSERSDIDIAVSGGDTDGFYWDVNENIWSLLSFDIVELDKGITDALKNEIDKEGIVIYEKT